MAARIFRINYKSDFILTMNSEAGWEIPFCIKFWTSIPSRAYFVGYDGETYTHCAYDPSEPTKLMVQFDDHHLPIGNLHFQISYHFTVDDFPNNTEDEVFNEAALTTEIDGETYQVMLDFNGETAPGIDFSLPSVGVTSVNGKVGVVTLTAEDVGAQPTIEDLATIRSGAAAGATAVQPAEMTAALATKQDTISDLATIRNGAAAGATAVQPATLQEGLATKQDTISDLATIRSGAAAGATAVQPAALTPIQTALQTIEAVIPSAASSQNQLADKNFVNSSIATNTANFVGTYNSLAELQAVQNPTNNDYGFVIETDAQGNEYYDRYKYVAASQQWLFEYKVESTPFTAAQWAAIQSGITSALVTKLTALPTAEQLSNQLAAKQDTISDLATIRSGAAKGATAYQKPGTGIPSTDLASAVQTSLERADEAAVRPYNTQSPDGMGYLVLDKDATFASQVTSTNTIYEIRYDYDLNGQTITPPAGCVLYFNGGSLTNGTINGDVNVQGEYLSTLNAQVFVGGINFNLYQNDAAINTSFIGMIPNDSTAAAYNANLLLKIINSGKNVNVDDKYYIANTNTISLSRELVISGITGNAGFILNTSQNGFSLNAGSSLKLCSLYLATNTYLRLILNQQIDYVINSVDIQDCIIEGDFRIEITGADVDYSQTQFGIKNFIFTNNTVSVPNSFIILTDNVIIDRFVMSDNIVTGMKYTFCHLGTTNENTYSNENLHTYSAPLYVERNKVLGAITDTNGYNTFLVAEASTVFYRDNQLENILNVGNGVSYDAYASSTNYYCEGNYFKNIATIPKSGTAKETPDEIGKSKGSGNIRYFNNNIWIQDYDEIKEILSESYSEFSSMESSVYESLSYVSIFRYVSAQKKVTFTNNKVIINAGKLKNSASTTESLGIVRIENNVFDCIIDGPIIAPRNNTSVYIENNEFLQPPAIGYYVLTSTYTLDMLRIKGNVFNGFYGHNGGNQNFKKYDISNNTFIGNQDFNGNIYLPKATNDGYIETEVSYMQDRSINVYNRSKIVLHYNTATRFFIELLSVFSYIKHTVLYDNVVLKEFYIERNGDACNVYDENLVLEKAVTANWQTYYSDSNFKIYVQKDCRTIFTKVNATYCEVRSEILKALPTKTFPTGLTANRPANVATGYQYFDTTLGKPIYYNGTSWVDATGAAV